MRKLGRVSNQTIGAAIIIGLAASVFAHNRYQANHFEAELKTIAEQCKNEYLSGVPDIENWQAVTTVAHAQEFGLFGERRALLHVFVRNTSPDAPKEHKFRGFEYTYRHDGAKWVFTGSASCTAKAHFGEGLKLFEEMDRIAKSAPS